MSNLKSNLKISEVKKVLKKIDGSLKSILILMESAGVDYYGLVRLSKEESDIWRIAYNDLRKVLLRILTEYNIPNR